MRLATRQLFRVRERHQVFSPLAGLATLAPGAVRTDGDLNFASVVDLLDFKDWKTNAGPQGQGMSIPEPGSLTLLFVAGILFVGSRRFRHAKL